ncbi:MAG TPA: hypothetical protein DER23_00490 [Clostridiales bacterium]|jgi:SOS response regulatory protein OraA/RecX|nr:hypothetical protein [Clostridiales bacterium]
MKVLAVFYNEKTGEMNIRCDTAVLSSDVKTYEESIKPLLPPEGEEVGDHLCRLLCLAHTESVLRIKAMRLLGMGDYTARGLLHKLYDTEVLGEKAEKEIARKIVIFCVKKGYIREKDYARRLIDRWIGDCRGEYYMLQKMREKKFRPGLAEELLDDEKKEQMRLALFDYVKNKRPGDKKERDRLVASLARRGYAYGDISDAMEAMGKEEFA